MATTREGPKAVSRRDHLVDTALDLFYRDGYHATGIDAVLARSGVAKMTLYKHFGSKDELILAVLRRHDERFREWFVDAVARRAGAPGDLPLAMFDALAEWFAGEGFHGCAFVNACAEYGDPGHPVHRAAAEHKHAVLATVRELVKAAGAPDWKRLGWELFLLIEGATAVALVTGDPKAAKRARAAAAKLIDAAYAAPKEA